MAGRYSDLEPLRDPVTGQLNRAEFFHRLKGWLAVALAFAVLLGGAAVGAVKGYQAWTAFKTASDYPGPGKAEVVVIIPKDTTVIGIGTILEKAGVVKKASKFQDVAASRSDEAKKLQAGRYKLQTQIPASLALSQLLDPGREVKIKLQLREGWTLAEQKAAIAAGTQIDPAELEKWFKTLTPGTGGLPAYIPTDRGALAPQGFLFPDTYEIPIDVKPGDMPKMAIAQFNAVAKKLNLDAAAAKIPVTAPSPYKAVIIASIVEKEVHREEDRGRVAQVIYNRLSKGMRLEMDSTVHYAVGDTSKTVRTTADQRKTKSKYNTYLEKGLPPTPIAAPSEASLAAALNPTAGNWLYFTVVNLDTGETKFSTTKAEHDVNVAALDAWCKAKPENAKKCG